MMAVAVSISAVYALYARIAVYPLLFALTLLAALLHMSGNAFNHYLDFSYKIDTKANALSQGPPRIIPLGLYLKKGGRSGFFGDANVRPHRLLPRNAERDMGNRHRGLGVTLFAVYDARPIQLKAGPLGK